MTFRLLKLGLWGRLPHMPQNYERNSEEKAASSPVAGNVDSLTDDTLFIPKVGRKRHELSGEFPTYHEDLSGPPITTFDVSRNSNPPNFSSSLSPNAWFNESLPPMNSPVLTGSYQSSNYAYAKLLKDNPRLLPPMWVTTNLDHVGIHVIYGDTDRDIMAVRDWGELLNETVYEINGELIVEHDRPQVGVFLRITCQLPQSSGV